eukprot:262290_1
MGNEESTSEEDAVSVILHVYQLPPEEQSIKAMIFQSGVEVYDKEYYYKGGTGILVKKPKSQPADSKCVYYQSHTISKNINKTNQEVKEIIVELEPHWKSDEYSISNNCNHFSNSFIKRLCGSEIVLPSYIYRMPKNENELKSNENYEIMIQQKELYDESVVSQLVQMGYEKNKCIEASYKCVDIHNINEVMHQVNTSNELNFNNSLIQQETETKENDEHKLCTNNLITTIEILNLDKEQSTVSATELITSENISKNAYIVSNVDEELLILIEFTDVTNLKSITLYSLNNDEHMSGPKEVQLYALSNLKINFYDLQPIKSDKKINCKQNKLEKGQNINLQTKSQDAIKFNKIKYFAIYIKSNQNETKKTCVSSIMFNEKHTTISESVTIYKTYETHPNGKIWAKYWKGTESDQYSYATKNRIEVIDAKEKADALQALVNIKHMNITATMNTISNTTNRINTKETKVYLDIDLADKIHHAVQTCDDKSCVLEKCDHLSNLTGVLCEYHSWIMQNDEDICKQFINSKQDIVCILNNFNHLLRFHHAEFENIYHKLIEKCNDGKVCELSDCLMMKRNYRNRSSMQSDFVDIYFNCNDMADIREQQILDKIHCFYFHSFDIGHKISYADSVLIQQKVEQEEKKVDDDEIEHDTSIISLHKYLMNKKQSSVHVNGFERIIRDKTKFCDTINSERCSMPQSAYLYSYGFTFFYWENYKNNIETSDPIHSKNQEANPGYKLCDFYVKNKHKDLKNELLDNDICCIDMIHWLMLTVTADKHAKTNHFKTFQCLTDTYECAYGIKPGTTITSMHLLVIMVYCNFDKLQREFTETFRKLTKNETFSSLINRHSNYAHLARLLRESVECFSTNIPHTFYGREIHVNYDQQTIFDKTLYYGITIKSQFVSLDAYIKGPVSTTTDFNVALNFSAMTGMVLQFTLDKEWSCNSLCGTCMFDCQFISDFPNELEIFFIGGYGRFVFKSILDVQAGNDYAPYVSVLTAISDLCYGGKLVNRKIFLSKLELKLCSAIILCYLGKINSSDSPQIDFQSVMPQYIKTLAFAHFSSITHMSIFQPNIYPNLQRIFYKLFFDDFQWIKMRLLIGVFPGLKEIEFLLQSTNEQFVENTNIYSSVLSLLKDLQTATFIQKIRIAIPNTRTVEYKANQIIKQFGNQFALFNWDISTYTVDQWFDGGEQEEKNRRRWIAMEYVAAMDNEHKNKSNNEKQETKFKVYKRPQDDHSDNEQLDDDL